MRSRRKFNPSSVEWFSTPLISMPIQDGTTIGDDSTLEFNFEIN